MNNIVGMTTQEQILAYFKEFETGPKKVPPKANPKIEKLVHGMPPPPKAPCDHVPPPITATNPRT